MALLRGKLLLGNCEAFVEFRLLFCGKLLKSPMLLKVIALNKRHPGALLTRLRAVANAL